MSLIIKPEHNVFKTKFSGAGYLIVTLLSLTILALLERVLYDIARLTAPPPLGYFDNNLIIIAHAVLIILFILVDSASL